jgi:hypothetical protein
MAFQFCAFLRRFSGKREKDQVSIGSGWQQWTQQASARIHSTVRSYFPMSNLDRWIGPAQVTSHPSHASPTRMAFRSHVPRTGAAFARGAEVPRVRSRADYDGGARPHAVARRARAALPGSPRAAAPAPRVAPAREFESFVVAGAGAREVAVAKSAWRRRMRRFADGGDVADSAKCAGFGRALARGDFVEGSSLLFHPDMGVPREHGARGVPSDAHDHLVAGPFSASRRLVLGAAGWIPGDRACCRRSSEMAVSQMAV